MEILFRLNGKCIDVNQKFICAISFVRKSSLMPTIAINVEVSLALKGVLVIKSEFLDLGYKSSQDY